MEYLSLITNFVFHQLVTRMCVCVELVNNNNKNIFIYSPFRVGGHIINLISSGLDELVNPKWLVVNSLVGNIIMAF